MSRFSANDLELTLSSEWQVLFISSKQYSAPYLKIMIRNCFSLRESVLTHGIATYKYFSIRYYLEIFTKIVKVINKKKSAL